MSQRVMNGPAALLAAAALIAALAAPAAAMEPAAATDTAGNAPDFQLRITELERRIDMIDERLALVAAAPGRAVETRPFAVTYFEELDRYGN